LISWTRIGCGTPGSDDILSVHVTGQTLAASESRIERALECGRCLGALDYDQIIVLAFLA
jgi:hypothetical protein